MPEQPEQPDIPDENGQPPRFDPKTGKVHGSGVGAGGGQEGEDFDSDAGSGDGYPQTGGEGTPYDDGNKGPARFKE